MRLKLVAGTAAVVLGLVGSASATPTISGSISTYPPAPFGLVDFGSSATPGMQPAGSPITVDGETFTFTGTSGVYSGDVSGVARSPFRNALTTNYLAAQPGGTLTITFATPQTSFDMLWGSVDTYNSLTFQGGETITGSDIAGAIPGVNFGTSDAAVMIANLTPFTTIQVTSTSPAFEFDPGTPVPEPASLTVLGMGLLGFGFIRRRRA